MPSPKALSALAAFRLRLAAPVLRTPCQKFCKARLSPGKSHIWASFFQGPPKMLLGFPTQIQGHPISRQIRGPHFLHISSAPQSILHSKRSGLPVREVEPQTRNSHPTVRLADATERKRRKKMDGAPRVQLGKSERPALSITCRARPIPLTHRAGSPCPSRWCGRPRLWPFLAMPCQSDLDPAKGQVSFRVSDLSRPRSAPCFDIGRAGQNGPEAIRLSIPIGKCTVTGSPLCTKPR